MNEQPLSNEDGGEKELDLIDWEGDDDSGNKNVYVNDLVCGELKHHIKALKDKSKEIE